MTNESTALENALERWDTPAAPENLLERCLSTVSQRPQKERVRTMLLARFLGTAVVVTTVAILTTNPARNWRNQTVTASAAFAESTQRSTSAPYWTRLWRNTNGTEARVWFDQDLGYAIANEDQLIPTKNYTIYLPNGDEYRRMEWKTEPGLVELAITHQGAKKWDELKRHAIYRQNSDPLGHLANYGRDEQVTEKTMCEGMYQGKPVRIFTIVSQFDKSTGEPRPLRRNTYYTDKETERFIAIHEESAPEGKPLELVGECEIRYERPNPSVFDTQRLKEGVKQTLENWPRSGNPNHKGPRMLLNGQEYMP